MAEVGQERPAAELDAGADPFAIDAASRVRLQAQVDRAVRAGRRGGTRLVAATWRLPSAVDPAEVVFASRRAGEAWICIEQPERDGAAFAGVGAAITLEDRGPGRFERLADRWRAVASAALWEPSDGPFGSGLVAAGGFAFADEGGGSVAWSDFAPASLVVPEVALARRDGETWCTVAALSQPGDHPDSVLARVEERLSALRARPLPLLDPHPTERHQIGGSLAPEHYEAAVERAVELIRRGDIEKIVLAREVEVHAPRAHDVAAVYDVLRGAFGGCFVFAVGRGDATLVGASPELLIRREGLRASTLALAGSTGRSADPAVDDHLGERMLRSAKERSEHAIVAARIERELRQHAVWVTMPSEPSVVRIANIQHLATPIRAQLAEPVDATLLAGLLHPTPALGGEPAERALPLIPALEGIDRGWYAGPVGWTDANGDGEFFVALRCALVEGRVARCYAGVGVVADSNPSAELAETEVKLGALLPVLS